MGLGRPGPRSRSWTACWVMFSAAGPYRRPRRRYPQMSITPRLMARCGNPCSPATVSDSTGQQPYGAAGAND